MSSSYNIGQLLRSSISSYSTDVTYSEGTAVNSETIIDFYDPCLNFSGSGSILSSLYSYYLKFTVTLRDDSAQTITIKLKDTNAEENNTQEIKTVIAKQAGDNEETTSFELVIHPNASYDQLIFELTRLSLDFTIVNEDTSSGRILDITIDEFYLINNVITDLQNSFSGLTTLSKIGIQSAPGLLFVIDGEEIRVGRSGIYELYNTDVEISYLGFVIKDSLFTQDGKDFFILDFKY